MARTLLIAIACILGCAPTLSGQEKSVSRLPPLALPLDPDVQKMFDATKAAGGSIINLQLVLAHAPKISRANSALAYALRFDAETPRLLRELTIMRTAYLLHADYEINQHGPLILACGYAPAKIEAIKTWQSSSFFDGRERALLAYVDQVAKGGDVDDATFETLSKFFSPREIVELTVTVGHYVANALLTKALHIENESDGRLTAAGKC